MPDSSACVACLITTTTGKVLVRWEQGTTLPFHFAQLSLLLSSLFHFAKGQEFAHIEMKNGYTIIICSDAVAQVSVATICLTPAEGSAPSAASPLAALEMMRLKSLIVLSAFVKEHLEAIEAIVDESKREAETKASQYTLSNALGGGSSDETDENEDDQTRDAFLAFQRSVVERVMGLSSREAVDRFKPKITGEDSAALKVVHGFVMNTESGEFVYSTPIPQSQQRRVAHKSVKVQRMLKQAALALHQCFPVLCQTSVLQRKENAGHVDASLNTTLVLQFSKTMEAGGSPTTAASSAEDVLVALRMMPVRTTRGIPLASHAVSYLSCACLARRSGRSLRACSCTARTRSSAATRTSSCAQANCSVC